MHNSTDIKETANALMVQGRFKDAITLLLKSLNTDPDDSDIMFGLGIAEFKQGNIDNALIWLNKACNIGIDDPACYLALASIQQQKQDTDGAIATYKAAISRHPDLLMAHLYLASLLMSTSQLDDAEYHYKYAIKLQPGNADAYANLAQSQELSNKLTNARKSAATALKISPDHIGALMALGRIEKRDKNYSDAEKIFKKIISLTGNTLLTAMASLELGHCLDKLKKYDAAFAASLSGKRMWIESSNNIPFDKTFYQKKIQSNRDLVNNNNYEYHKNTTQECGHIDPVFFIGFPRSGTTLLEQILNQHADVVTSDEIPLIDNLITRMPSILDSKIPYPDCMQDFTKNDLALLRDSYWSDAKNNIIGLEPDKVLIDKLPLNIIELDFITRLFPDSHILVAIRDPRAVCLSCFMQAFTPNPAMINFINMKDTVDFYDNVMSLWLQYRDTLSINWYQYRYEDLVEDFDKTTRGIFEFIGLDYPENAGSFHEAAKHRVISTPSYQDVATPIYKRSKERWRQYEKYFLPHMDKLEPYIREFGYQL